MPRTRRAPARRAPLSHDRVITAAAALADEVGIEALSMRRLGEVLGVEAMSLYKHVANKDAVLDGLLEFIARQLEPPTAGGDWKAALRRRSHRTHEVLMRHRWGAFLMMSRANVGPAMMAYVDATIGCLRAAGFSWKLTDHAWNAIDNHVYGYTLQRLNFPFEPKDYARAARENLHRLPAELFPHLHAMATEVAAGRHDGLQDFGFGLDMILDGLERRLAQR